MNKLTVADPETRSVDLVSREHRATENPISGDIRRREN